MVREFKDYKSLSDSLELLKRNARILPRTETVPLETTLGRILCEDVVSKVDIPARDSSHMDGFALRALDVAGATATSPVTLRRVKGPPLGTLPRTSVKRGEAHSVPTGGFLPKGADSVVQIEKVRDTQGTVEVSGPVELGQYVYPRGKDVKKGDVVLPAGRAVRGTDQVLLASMHIDRVRVYANPRVAIVPTGNELSERIRGTEAGKIPESHTLLLSRLVEGAGGVPVKLPVAPDDLGEISRSIRKALSAAEIVLTVAGSSVSEADLTEEAINRSGRPGVLVHGMKVHRGRVMGFGVIRGKLVLILPGPIQGAVNAFTMVAYPLIRALQGRGFELPPSIPARMGNDWDAGSRYRDFTKVVYVKINSKGPEVTVDASLGETERVTFLTQNDGFILAGEPVVFIGKGEPVRVYLLPGFSSLE